MLRFISIFLSAIVFSEALKYPNEVVDTPNVICETDSMIIRIKTTSSNPSKIYADDYENDKECYTRNSNRLTVPHGKCGMKVETTQNPSGSVQRVCITVQLHPLFVTEADRSYCAQCIYVESRILDDIHSSLEISDAPPTEIAAQFDESQMPKCSYSLRKESESGAEVRYASVGDTVFHVWACDGEHNGILVQNCHVEDGQGNKIMIIDQNGCGIDHYVMPTPMYSADQSKAFQETHVFKFAQRTITRFICQIRICLKGDDCKVMSPPKSCPSLEERLEEVQKKETEESADAVFASNDQLFREAQMPSSRPTNRAADDPVSAEITPAKGSIYYGVGFNPKRQRREVLIDNKTSERRDRIKMRNGHPEMQMIGELRVFESPQDVEYFESRTAPSSCDTSHLAFTLLVTALIVASILLITMILLITSRINSRKNNALHLAR
ncbi:unnamed protein product [Caenorhabditis auriculariae]|uniref:ZP domain-containing protein n=1 Tax=Caenorhabditis auriculariae TaxID=2777116 RepID=A0A8S1H4L1_9PELO|nr:unnamed protein product [Caenorhabditis auriculariae]